MISVSELQSRSSRPNYLRWFPPTYCSYSRFSRVFRLDREVTGESIIKTLWIHLPPGLWRSTNQYHKWAKVLSLSIRWHPSRNPKDPSYQLCSSSLRMIPLHANTNNHLGSWGHWSHSIFVFCLLKCLLMAPEQYFTNFFGLPYGTHSHSHTEKDPNSKPSSSSWTLDSCQQVASTFLLGYCFGSQEGNFRVAFCCLTPDR